MQQGNYPIGNRVLAPTDTVTGVVTGTTADIPLSALATYVASSLTTVDITGGTISGVAISASTISGSTGSFTSISGNGNGITGTATGLNIGGNAATATISLDIAGGAANRIPYQNAPSTTTFIDAPVSANTVLGWNGTTFLWTPAGSGTVTNVAVSGGTTGLTTSGGPITTNGTITLGGVLVVANGGTGGTTQATARSGIAAAASGANSDIISLTGLTTPLSVVQGGTSATTGATSKIQPITVTVASNALTLGLSQTTLDMRSSTLSSGTVAQRSIVSAISLIVPSGATLGTFGTVLSRLLILAIDNAGAEELAVVNAAGGVNLNENTLVSTTSIGAGSSSMSIIYSNTARTNVAFRVVGYVESTQTTAGAWASTPSTIQGVGGNVLLSGGVYAYFREQETLATNGGTFTAGAYRTRTINATVNGASFAALAVNQITLQTGTYTIRARAPAYEVDGNQTRLQNITASSTLGYSNTCRTPSAVDNSGSIAEINARFTVASTTVIELQHICNTTGSGTGFGTAANVGTGLTEVYSEIQIWKEV